MEPRYAFAVLVLGSNTAPPELVAEKLDLFLAPRLADRLVVLLLRSGEDHAANWTHDRAYCRVQLEHPDRVDGGRWTAETRWALRVAGMADAAVVFGDERPWWRVLRYCAEAKVPVRRVKAPAGYVRREPTEQRVPWRFDVADPLNQPPAVLDGAGPGGWPD